MEYANPNLLISTEQLAATLEDPQLRMFDTAVHLRPQPGGTYEMISGREDYLAAHIPGAGFIDLGNDWADAADDLRFTLPEIGALQTAIGRSGISAEHDVVLYSSGHMMWATRAFWLLRYAGHTRCRILNGNLSAWQREGRPVNTGPEQYPSAIFAATPQIAAFADLAEVEAGMHGRVCTINALNQELYEGTGDFYYQRRGHIPGSKLLGFDDILDNEYLLDAPDLARALQEKGMLDADRVITYCGGGIAATLDAYACVLMGQERVGVYDGSMSEWVQDQDRPLTTGAQP
ncbi:MAG: sulfurtransferase [Pseudomonadota bacterium]